MSRVRQEVASVIFQADARKANASMEALQEKANSLNDAITGVKQQIEALGNVAPDHQGLISYQQQLRKLNSDLKDVQKTMSDYMRGVKAADQLWQSYMRGDIEGLSLKAIKAGQNGLRKRMENLSPGNPDDQKTLRAYEEVIKEADLVVNKFKTDAAETIQILRDGGTVSEQAMKKARDGVKSLMETVEEGTQEYRQFSQQYEYLAAKTIEFTEAQRRAKGEIVDANDARRAAVRLTREGAEAAAREREAQDAVITAQQKEIEQTRTLRQEKEKEIEQTNSQMATNMRLADAAMAERRQMEDDYQASLGAIAAEKRQQAQQQAQAAHDEADQMRANAQLAEQTAQQKRTAYEQETQTVTQLDGEVKKLTEDIKAMSAEPVKPKVDTSEIEKLNAELKEAQRVLGNASAFEKLAQAKLEGMRSAHATQEAGFRSKEAELRKFTDATYELQERRNELDWAIEPFSRRHRQGYNHFDVHDVEQQRVAVEKLDEAFRRLHDDEYFKNASLSRQYELLGTAAFGYSDAERQFGSYERAIRSLGVALEETGAKARLVFQGAGVDKSFQGVEFLEGYVTRRKEIAQLNSEIKNALGDTDIDALAREVETERRIFNEGTEALQEQEREVERWGKLKQEYADKAAEAERKYSEAQQQAQQQSTQTSDEYQRKQAELTAKTDQLAQAKQRQAKAQGEMNTAEQQAAKAQEDANQKQVEAIQLGEKAAQAEREAATEQERHNEVLQRQDEKIAKLNSEYDALDDTLKKQEGELTAYDQKVAQSEQAIAEAERKKAQARELSAKDMRDAIAALRERNDAIGEANPEWEKNERLIAQYNKRLEEMKQRSQELRGEVMSLSEAMQLVGEIGKEGFVSTPEQMQQATKAIEQQREATIKLIQEKHRAGEATDNERQLLTQLDGALAKIKTGYANAEEVIQRFNQHLGEPKIETATQQTEKLAQTLDEKLNAATSEYDDNIKHCLESIDYWEKELKESEDKVASLEAEYNNLVKLLNSGNPFKRLQGEMKGGWKRADNIQSWLEGDESADNYGWRPAVNDAKNNIRSWKESLDFWKEKKAEALGLNEAEEQVAQTEEKLQQTRRMTRDELQQGIKILEEEAIAQDRSTVDGQKKWEQLRSVIDQMNQELKESTGEWMSLADAEKLAEQAGENYYLSEGKSGFVASPEEIQKATQALERQRDALIKTIQAKKANKEATDAEEKELADLTKKLRDLKFEQDNVNMSQEKMRMLMKQPAQAVSLDELRAAIKRADGELRRMEGSLGKNSKEYKAFAEQVKVAKNTLKDMEGAAKASASAWEKAVSRLKTYVGLYMGFNILWQKVTSTAGDLLTLSDKMGEVRKTTQMTADQVGRLSDALTKLDTRTSLTGLMEFSSLAGSIGLKTQEDVQGFTEAANMLSVSLPELGSEASRTLMKIADATGDLEKNGNNVRETLERVGSTVIALRANSAAAAGPITDFVSRVGAVGAQAGISIDQIAALGATVDALGGRVEMSATALSRMIPAIRNNTFEVAQAIGMTEKQLKSMSGIDQMVAVFKALHDSVKNFDMTTEEGMNAAADAVEGMLGRSVSMQDVMKQLNQQGARAGIVFGLLSQNVDTLEKQLRIAGDAYKDNTALMDEYNKMNDTAAAKWERLKNQLEEAFVSDRMQRLLGGIITALRTLVDFISGNVTGAVHALHIAVISLATGFGVLKTGIGAAFVGMGGLATAFTNLRITIGLAIGDMGRYIALKWALVRAHDEEAKAAIRAKLATTGATKAMMANVVLAFVAALGMLVWKLYEAGKAAKEAAAETGRFNQQIADEQKALGELFKPLDKSNTAQEERLRLINEINSKYGKYLGYMLSETSSAIQLADAHALIAKRIREEAYERRIADKEAKIQDEHSEDVNAAYTKITERVRGSVRGGASAQEIADVLKGIVDNRLGSIKYAYDNSDNIFKARTNYYLDPKIKQAIDGGIERLIVDGKLSRDNVTLIQKAVYKYTVEAHSQHKDIMDQTSNLRSDLRGVQSAIKVDLANNLNTLVSRVASSVGNAVRNIRQQQQPQQNVPLMLQQPQGQGSGLPSLFGGGQQGGWQAPWQQQRETTPDQQMAPKGWKPNIDKKDTEAVRQFVQDQEALRSALNASGNQIDEAQRRVAESWLLTDAELKEYKKIVEKADRGPGGSNHNPYGDYNDRVDPYEQWDANALVARRKEMLERVKALANGADVQAVLSEDKRFMDEATRKGIKNMRDAIAWYNEERLKIQEELDARNLTPTGDWKNPEKGGRSKKKPKTPESEGAIAELDRYYSERKELIEEARANEQMTEAEYNRRLDALEQEHLTKRSELRQTFTSEDKQFIQQFRQWWASVKELDEVSWTAIEAEWIAAWERDRKYNNREAQKDLTAMQAIVVKQLKEIEAIIAKERPFNGITDNLQNNLTKMGLLFKDGVPEDGKFMEENTKRLTFLLKEAENAYSLTFDQLSEDMRKNGLGSWADAIINSENADKEKRALIAQLHEVYDSVQDAIKKEASQVKKQVDIAWNDAILPNGKSIKATYEAAISALGVEQSSVSRANNLIGAGVASERVADRLAIKQLQLQLRMQEHYYNLVRKTGQQRVDDLLREAKLREDEGKTNEAERLRLDAKHAQMSLNLSLAKEETELAKQREEIIARTEESQNRLYTELKEWADLLTSSIQGVMEASNAGNAEYYNERAKMNLTGKGGPGAGTYVVIDDAGTSDATAHYEYLDERQALERQHEIEQQNAQAEAWKKVMDDINMKLSETITDQLNAMLQNQSIDANTTALNTLTGAVNNLAGVMGGQPTGDYARNAEGMAVDASGNVVYPVQPTAPATEQPAEGGAPVSYWPMSEEHKEQIAGWNNELWQRYGEAGIETMQTMSDATAGMPSVVTNPYPASEEQVEQIGEMYVTLSQKRIAADNAATQSQLNNQQKLRQGEQQTDQQMTKSAGNMYAKMTQAANLYGIAYQTMSNDNLSTSQKFQMMAVQSAGQAAIAMLTTNWAKDQGQVAGSLPAILAECLKINPIAGAAIFAVLTGLLGGLMGVAVSKITKHKSEIAQTTGSSASAGRLATGMQTYKEGNVDAFTDPASLTPGKSYNVDAADGKTYRAKYTGTNPRTHLTNGPEFHLAGEAGREMIIDAGTTRQITMNENEIWRAIQTLSSGGRLSHYGSRRSGMRVFAEGNVDDFADYEEVTDGAGLGFDPVALQASLDRNSAVQEALLERLSQPIQAKFDVYGKGGLVDSYDTGKKTTQRHGVRY